MGGVATSIDGGSSLPGLYAVGECGCTGLHGANRLASNSLAECFVFGYRAGRAALNEPEPFGSAPQPQPGPSPVPPPETREALWRLAGLQRTAEQLERLREDRFPLARLIAESALARRESRGAHQRRDFPIPDPRYDGMHLTVYDDGGVRQELWE
jgi:L-aspartate oxidase